MKKVIVITGPTGVGKTKFSIELAKALNTEIINGDAYQIYKYMNIGTAKPTDIEKQGIPHHLMDFLDPRENFSICDYQKLVRDKIEEFHNKKMIPIITGGSGLYIDSVLYDYRFTEDARNIEDEKKYDHLSNEELHNILKNLNQESAKKIHPNNRKRVLRAIELSISGIDNEDRNQKHNKMYDFLLIFLNDEREVLYERINKRVDEMVNTGLLEEVKSLYPDKLSHQAVKAIGYQEIYDYLDNKISLDEAINLIKQHSRNYAKRQMTWYRNRENVLEVFININNLEETKNKLFNIVDEFLK